jgi:WD40 repeat protein
MRPRILAATIVVPVALLLAAGGAGLALRAKRVEWPRRFSGVSASLPFLPPSRLECAALSSDGNTLLTGSLDGHLEAWDMPTNRKRFSLSPQNSCFFAVAVSPNNALVADGSNWRGTGTVTLRDTRTGAPRAALQGFAGTFRNLHFSPSSKLIAIGSDEVTIWNVQTGALLRKLKGHQPPVQSVAFSPDEKILATADGAGAIRLWSVETGKQLQKWKAYVYRADAVAFSPDGKTLATAGRLVGDSTRKGSIDLWDLNAKSLSEKKRVSVPARILWHTLDYLPDGRLAYCPTADSIALLDQKGVSHPLGESKDILSIAVSPNSPRVTAVNEEGTALVWNAP